MITSLIINVPGEYISLGLVLQAALEQASKGKGKERHAEADELFENQIICEVARRTGTGFCLGQAVKKIYESQRLIPQLGVQELLGAMNYLAAAVIVMQERMDEEGRRFRDGFAHAEGGCCQNGQDGEHIVSSDDLGPVTVKDKDIRHAPKAEGCEELVHDAPQTPEEVCRHIVESNPATYGQPRTPTGEELAEMAEEDVYGE